MAGESASAGPRFAPEDPTLPKPWKGLVDGNTGYLYYWNPETNVTQYERPTSQPDYASLPNGGSQKSSQGQLDDSCLSGSYGRSENGGGGGSHKSYGGGNVPSSHGYVSESVKGQPGQGPLVSSDGVHAVSIHSNHGNRTSHTPVSFEPSVNTPQDPKKDISSSGMAAAPASSAPRYAPEDPTLPKPWKGLIDGNTGYLYFWNPVINVTVYERPTTHPDIVTSLNGNSNGSGTGSLAQGQRPSHTSQPGYAYNRADTRFGGVPADLTVVSAGGNAQGPGDTVDGTAAENYRRHNEITVSGNNVPHPFISFESTSLPFEILREVRYLLQLGANVVHCVSLHVLGMHVIRDPSYGGPKF